MDIYLSNFLIKLKRMISNIVNFEVKDPVGELPFSRIKFPYLFRYRCGLSSKEKTTKGISAYYRRYNNHQILVFINSKNNKNKQLHDIQVINSNYKLKETLSERLL